MTNTNNIGGPRPPGIIGRVSRRLFLGTAAVSTVVVVDACTPSAPPPPPSGPRSAIGIFFNRANHKISSAFQRIWKKRLPKHLATALKPIGNGGFMHNIGNASYVWRPQNADTVSEGPAYFMETLTNTGEAYRRRVVDGVNLQDNFGRILNGVLASRNENGLMPWRMEYDIKTRTMKPMSISDSFSATDADIIIAHALIRADALVEAGTWSTPTNERGVPEKRYYARLAADMLARIKAYDIVDKNGRLILAVSDQWGHKDLPKEAVTFNPSYTILAALRDFAEFDIHAKEYWLQVRSDNFAVVEATVTLSEEAFENIADPTKRAEHTVTFQDAGRTYYALDWFHRDLLENLLNQNGWEITPFGVEVLRKPGDRARVNKEKFKALKRTGARPLSFPARGKLIIEQAMLEEVVRKIRSGDATVPFTPDQVEVIVKKDGKMIVRPEMGEANLNFPQYFDGVRMPLELARDIILHDDASDATVPAKYKISGRAVSLAQKLVNGKDLETLRIGRYRRLAGHACYLMGAIGAGSSRRTRAFEAEFNEYTEREETGVIRRVRGVTRLVLRKRRTRRSRNGGNIFDYQGNQKEYYSTVLTFRALSAALKDATDDSTSTLKVKPLATQTPTVPPLKERLAEDLPEALSVFGFTLPSEIKYFQETVTNDVLYDIVTGQETEPQYSVTAEKMYDDAHRAIAARPNSATARYNAAASSRNIGLYRQSASEFFEVLQVANFEDSPSVVRATIINMILTMSTLNYGFAVIGDTLESILETEEFDQGTRLAIRAAAIQMFNHGGNHVKALRMSIQFMEEYQNYSGMVVPGQSPLEKALRKLYGFDLLKRVHNRTENTTSPSQQLLTDVLTSTMETIAEFGHLQVERLPLANSTATYPVHSIAFEHETALAIPEIIFSGAAPRGTGDIREALILAQKLKGEVATVHRSRFVFAQARIYQKMAQYRVRAAEQIRDIDAGVLGEDIGSALLKPWYEEAAEFSEQALVRSAEALALEMDGGRNFLQLQQMLDARVYVLSFCADKIRGGIRTRKVDEAQAYDYLPGTEDNSAPTFEQHAASDLEYKKALFFNYLQQRALRDLSLLDFSGLTFHQAEKIKIAGHIALGATAALAGVRVLRSESNLERLWKASTTSVIGAGTAGMLYYIASKSGIIELARESKIFTDAELKMFEDAQNDLASIPLSPTTKVIYDSAPIRGLCPQLRIRRTMRETTKRLSPNTRKLFLMHDSDWTVNFGLSSLGEPVLDENQFERPTTRAYKAVIIAKLKSEGYIDPRSGVLQTKFDGNRATFLRAFVLPGVPRRQALLLANQTFTIMNYCRNRTYLNGPRTALPVGDQAVLKDLEVLARIYHGEFYGIAEEYYSASREVATNNPSVDPRTVAQIMSIRKAIDIQTSRAELPPLSRQEEVLKEALAMSEKIPTFKLSNEEHRISLIVDTVTQSMIAIHKLLEIERKKARASTGLTSVSSSLPEFRRISRIMQARLGAMLEGKLPPGLIGDPKLENDPIVVLFKDPKNRPVVKRVFVKFPRKASLAWSSSGNLAWWGSASGNLANYDRAVPLYKKSLEYDALNTDALRGLLQIYTNSTYLRRRLSAWRPQYKPIYRLFYRALRSIQQGNVPQSVINDILAIPTKLPPGGKRAKLEVIAGQGYSNSAKIQNMLYELQGFVN